LKILTLIRDKNINITFTKVKAHIATLAFLWMN